MKKTIICLIPIFIIAIAPVLLAEKSIDQRIADLEKKLPEAPGIERVKALNELSYVYYIKSPYKTIEYGSRALELSRQLKYRQGEGEALNNIGFGYLVSGNYKKGLEFFQKSLQVFKKINDKESIAVILNNVGDSYRRMSEYSKALEYLLESLRMQEKLGKNKTMGVILYNLGRVYKILNNNSKALDFHLRALQIREELGEKKAISASLQFIGDIYLIQKKPDKALEYHLKALKITEEMGDKAAFAKTASLTGLAYHHLKDYHQALGYFNKALRIAEEMDIKRDMAHNAKHIAAVYEDLEDYSHALEYYQKAAKIGEKIGEKWVQASSSIGIGWGNLKSRDYNQAQENIEKGIKIAKEIHANDLIIQGFEKLSYLYSVKGDYQKALEYYKRFHQKDRAVLNEEKSRHLNKLQVSYEAEKSAKEIEDLKKNNEIQQLRLSRERITRYALIIGFILVLFIFALLFKKYLYLLAFWKKQKYIGQFKLMEKIGSGGMGTIFKAHSIHDKSDFAAVKILKEELFSDAISKKRFKREAAIIDKLEHPNIIKIFERGESKQTLFIAMEFLEGKTLESKINEEGPLRLRESLHIMVQISDALAFIHSKNIIHRDLKPANIMLIERNGHPNFVKLLDFGLAKMELETRLTQSGNFLGTLRYLAPEQVLESHSEPANDIFSLGVTFYQMLCGKSPFSGKTVVDIMRQIIVKEPSEVSECRSDIPRELNDLVMNMLDKEPQQRPSAGSIRDSLQHLINQH